MVAVDQSRRLGRKTWTVSLGISRSAGQLFGVIKLQSFLVLLPSLLFLMVAFDDISIGRVA